MCRLGRLAPDFGLDRLLADADDDRDLVGARLGHRRRARARAWLCPASSWRTLGLREAMRLPSPAAEDHGQAQVILALSIGGANRVQELEAVLAAERHQPGVAPGDIEFAVQEVFVLANGDQAVAVEDEAAIAGRVVRLEAEDHNGRAALGQGLPQAGEGRGAHERRIAEGDQNIVIAFRESRFCGEHGMRRPKRRGLDENLGLGRLAPDFGFDRLLADADDDRDLWAPSLEMAESTCASMDCPASSWRTFGFREAMRLPSPAARTTAKQRRRVVSVDVMERGASCAENLPNHARAAVSRRLIGLGPETLSKTSEMGLPRRHDAAGVPVRPT